MNTRKKTTSDDLKYILCDGKFLSFCEKINNEGFPQFLKVYKKENDKIIVYYSDLRQATEEMSIEQFLLKEGEEMLETSNYFIVASGDPKEFIRFISSDTLYEYFIEVAKKDFDSIVFPDIFNKDLVDKMLERIASKLMEFKYMNSTAQKQIKGIQLQQFITWGLTAISIGLAIYSTFFK